ncbi:MAG TPA: OsmC family protein [Candidatus Baltobacteraceae bacterium]
MHNPHRFTTELAWTGNRGTGTSSYRAYGRDHEITAPGKTLAIPASSTPAFRGDAGRYNPEELLIGSLSGCHMLWFLHLCAQAGITVTAYADNAEGTMHVNGDGSGEFTEVVLHPRAQYAQAPAREQIEKLHHRAHELCFIARSVNFPVRCNPES